MRQGVAHQAHAPEDQQHAHGAAAQGQGQTGDQGVAHKHEVLEGSQEKGKKIGQHVLLRRQASAVSSQASDIRRASCRFSGVRISAVSPQPMGSRASSRVLGK